MNLHYKRRNDDEQGVTLVLMAVSLAVLVGLAALAIDVVSLYVAHADAQRAASAAALAGARGFVSSGFTSGLLGNPNVNATQDLVCTNNVNGGTIVNVLADKTAGQNQVAGQPAVIQAIGCSFPANGLNPRVTVTVHRVGLPSFFARIWGNSANSVSATATAEAYNASGLGTPIQSSVKPFLIPNCDPNGAFPCAGGNYFFDPTNGNLLNQSVYENQGFTFRQRDPGGSAPNRFYYVVDPSDLAPGTQCPTNGGECIGSGPVYDSVACGNAPQIRCGRALKVFTGTPNLQTRTDVREGTMCLIHTTSVGPPGGTPEQDQFTTGPNPVITGGSDNPDTSFQNVTNISRSDSLITVPVYAGTSDPCAGGTCVPVPVIGFLHLGIQYTTPNASIHAVVLNAVGCSPSAAGNPISGGGVSPVPVRLINTFP